MSVEQAICEPQLQTRVSEINSSAELPWNTNEFGLAARLD